MEKHSLEKLLKNNAYPGRGIVMGLHPDGRTGICAYFIMGRSMNSRNRVFSKTQDGIRTEAFDSGKMTDPALIIYAPVRRFLENLIVTNGDQTDTVYDFLARGESFEAALRTRIFEPDAPNFTPRISGVMKRGEGGVSYKLSILKSNGGNPDAPQRFFYEYPSPVPGEGHLIHTYKEDGNPIPSFEGEPVRVETGGDIDSFTETVWQSLNADNKVSLFVRYWNGETGAEETRIVNKNC